MESEELGALQSYLVNSGVFIGCVTTKASHSMFDVSGGQGWEVLFAPVLTLLHDVLW